MESTDDLDAILGKQEAHATFRDARLVAVSLDYHEQRGGSRRGTCAWETRTTRCGRPASDDARVVSILSGVVFWVMDPPRALDTRPGLPGLAEVTPLSDSTDGDRPATRSAYSRPETSGWCFFFASGSAHMYCGARKLAFEWA